MIEVLSCGVTDCHITEEIRDIAKSCSKLAGADRLLDKFPEFKRNKISLNHDIYKKLKTLIQESNDERIGILASGDALFYGIGNLILSLADAKNINIVSNVSSVQYAASKIKINTSNLQTISVHGRNNHLNVLELYGKTTAVLCDNNRTPEHIAEELIRSDISLANKSVVIAEDLGLHSEKFTRLHLKELIGKTFSTLVVMFVLLEDKKSYQKTINIGLDDCEYEKSGNCITHTEVRAIVLSKLKLTGGITIWDIGAGSGSVGIEAGSISDNSTVHFVECKSDRCKNIEKNIKKHGHFKWQIYNNYFSDIKNKLPSPDRVFIGGSGSSISETIKESLTRLNEKGRIVVTAVMSETISEIEMIFAEKIIDDVEIIVRKKTKLGSGSILRPMNPIRIFTLENI